MGDAVIVVPDDFPAALAGTPALARLKTIGRVTHHETRPADAAELARRIAGAAVVLNIRAYSKFTADLLAGCPTLRLISVWGTGTDHVDLEACRRRGVAVSNTPGANALAVAEHTVALMLAAARQVPRLDRQVRDGAWPRGLSIQLHGKTLGIIGFGSIGRQFASLAKGIGMEVLSWTFHPDAVRPAPTGIRFVPLDHLLSQADVISIHIRASEKTRRLLNREAFQKMKPSGILVNTARASIVDSEAMIAALKSGRLAAAGLDVFDQEVPTKTNWVGRSTCRLCTASNKGRSPRLIWFSSAICTTLFWR
jgi:D-3-phosphoglycerate dehydrogenase